MGFGHLVVTPAGGWRSIGLLKKKLFRGQFIPQGYDHTPNFHSNFVNIDTFLALIASHFGPEDVFAKIEGQQQLRLGLSSILVFKTTTCSA